MLRTKTLDLGDLIKATVDDPYTVAKAVTKINVYSLGELEEFIGVLQKKTIIGYNAFVQACADCGIPMKGRIQ